MWLLRVWVVMSYCLYLVQSDLFTAVADLGDLLDTEGLLIGTLDRYIQRTEKQLEQLKWKAEEFRKEHSMAREDASGYLANPINAYLLIKRLLTTESLMDDEPILDLALHSPGNFKDVRRYMKFPTDVDLRGAAMALIRLQEIYNLDVSSLANGELLGVKYPTRLSSEECFELGKVLYFLVEDYRNTALWMTEALNLYEAEPLQMNATGTVPPKWEILEYLAFSTYKTGNVKSALDLTNELLELKPDHEKALENKAYFEDFIKNENTSDEIEEVIKDDISEDGKEPSEAGNELNFLDPEDQMLYVKACRGDVSPPNNITSKLKCQYVSLTPFSRLARIKEEEAFLDPRIVLFRDVLYDSEIEVIKKLATSRLKRAASRNRDSGNYETADYRIAKSAWLMDDESDVVARVTRRIEDMTGLSTETSEPLQVANYGIGGFYAPHLDFDGTGRPVGAAGTGDRIATVLFYMSDVKLGGATAFPDLQVAVSPQKGSAVFWMNLKKSGEGDFRTWHAACPVIAGSKWVGNIWLHEKGQDSRRPCSLNPEE